MSAPLKLTLTTESNAVQGRSERVFLKSLISQYQGVCW
jgi:hypothetical protein